MADSTEVTMRRAITVPFHGAELYLVEHDGQPYTPMKPIAEGVGVSWQGQHEKLATNRERWRIKEILIPSAGGHQMMLCLPLRKLVGWLMTLSPNKIKNPEVRGRIIQYQNECDDALWHYWNDGIAVSPRFSYRLNSGDLLTVEQADTLRELVKSTAGQLSQDTKQQGKFIMQVWSKLKAHYKVTYRKIPQDSLQEALSIVARHAVNWGAAENASARSLASSDHNPVTRTKFAVNDAQAVLF